MFLVTEGADLLSSHIIVRLLKTGCKVRTTVSNFNETIASELSGLCDEAKDNLEVLHFNPEDEKGWQSVLSGVSGVFLSGLLISPCSFSPSNQAKLLDEKVAIVMCALRACADVDSVTRVVFTSSISAIAGGRKSESDSLKLSEADWSEASSDLSSAFEKISTAMERASWDFVNSFGEKPKFELVCLNPGMLVGPLLTTCNSSEQDMISSYLKGEDVCARIAWSFVDVRDAAAAHVIAMTSSDVGGGRFLLHGESLWLKDVVELLKKHFQPLGYKLSACVIPDGLLKFAGIFSKSAKIIHGMLGKKTDFDTTKMTAGLGVPRHSIEAAIADMGHSLIHFGIVPATQLYKSKEGPPDYDQLYANVLPVPEQSAEGSE